MRFQDDHNSNVSKTVRFCRKASNVGILGIYCSAQRDRKRAVRQPAAAPFRPLAQHNYPDIQGLKKEFIYKDKTEWMVFVWNEFELYL